MPATNTMLDTALAYHRAGLVVLPNDPAQKYPAGFKGWETMETSEALIQSWFSRPGKAIGVRDREGLDFDNKGHPSADTLYQRWEQLVEMLVPGLARRLLCERTPSGGYHLVWACDTIERNQKLATRPPTPEELTHDPKKTSIALIETRGQGGQFQVAPSPGYILLRGAWTALPEITTAERQVLLDCARALSQGDRRLIDTTAKSAGRPGDTYNTDHQDEALQLLLTAGWRVMYERDQAQYLCRPGKERGVSATFGYVAPGVLYVFSSNASPFDSGHAYSPFAIYTELEHGGDYKKAAGALRVQEHGGTTRIRGQTKEQTRPGGNTSESTYTTSPSLPIDANDLLALERRPIRWFAPGFVRQGLGLLVGQPGVGKTPLVIQLAIAMANGNQWLNAVDCPRVRVLYLGMEYSEQELLPLVDISRCGMAIDRGQLQFKTIDDDDIFPATPEAALAQLEYYIAALKFDVIMIDVLTGFLPNEGFKQNVYRGDYSELKPYHRLAMQHNAAILGVWHASKREADPRLMYNGSTGMWAACASRITMYADQEQRVRIASFPRLSDKTDWALAQHQNLAGRRWVLADAAPEPMCSPTELAIYRCLKANADKTRPLGPTTVAELISVPIGTAKSALVRMFERNLIQQIKGMSGYFVEVVATVATPTSDATLATLATPSEVEVVASATHLQPTDTALESAKTGGLQRLHDSTVAQGCNENTPAANGSEQATEGINDTDLLKDAQMLTTAQNGATDDSNRQKDRDRAYDERQIELAHRYMDSERWDKAAHTIGGMRNAERRKEMGRVLLKLQEESK